MVLEDKIQDLKKYLLLQQQRIDTRLFLIGY